MGADGRLFAMLVTKTDEFVNYRYIGAGRAVRSGQFARSKSCRGAGRQWRPQKAAGILKHRPSRQARPQPFEGSQGGTPCPVI